MSKEREEGVQYIATAALVKEQERQKRQRAHQRHYTERCRGNFRWTEDPERDKCDACGCTRQHVTGTD